MNSVDVSKIRGVDGTRRILPQRVRTTRALDVKSGYFDVMMHLPGGLGGEVLCWFVDNEGALASADVALDTGGLFTLPADSREPVEVACA